MINPMQLMKLREMGQRFQNNHPRLPGFFRAAVSGIREGSILEMTVTDPEGKKLCANIKVTADDMQMLNEFFQQMPRQ